MKPLSFSLRSNRLHGRREEAWLTHHTAYCIDIPRNTATDSTGYTVLQTLSVNPEYTLDTAAIYGENRKDAAFIVEIGSGLGETIAHASSLHPEKNYLAVEVFTPGLASTILRLEQRKKTAIGTPRNQPSSSMTANNVRLAQADAAQLLETAIAPRSVSELWIFFPDPWPKRRHHKRRLLTADFLDLAARVLIPQGRLRLASDWDHYALAMRDILDADPRFTNEYPHESAGKTFRVSGTKGRPGGAASQEIPLEEDITLVDTIGGWAPRFRERPLTSYEKKAHQAGHAIHDLSYRISTFHATEEH